MDVEKCTEALSDEMQRAALTCYDYICKKSGRKYGTITETSEAL